MKVWSGFFFIVLCYMQGLHASWLGASNRSSILKRKQVNMLLLHAELKGHAITGFQKYSFQDVKRTGWSARQYELLQGAAKRLAIDCDVVPFLLLSEKDDLKKPLDILKIWSGSEADFMFLAGTALLACKKSLLSYNRVETTETMNATKQVAGVQALGCKQCLKSHIDKRKAALVSVKHGEVMMNAGFFLYTEAKGFTEVCKEMPLPEKRCDARICCQIDVE